MFCGECFFLGVSLTVVTELEEGHPAASHFLANVSEARRDRFVGIPVGSCISSNYFLVVVVLESARADWATVKYR